MVNICKASFWKSLFLPIVLLSLVTIAHGNIQSVRQATSGSAGDR